MLPWALALWSSRPRRKAAGAYGRRLPSLVYSVAVSVSEISGRAGVMAAADSSSRLVLNPDDLNQDSPAAGIALAVELRARLELRVVFGRNLLLLEDDEIAMLKSMLDASLIEVAAIASPLFKWSSAREGQHSRVDRFGFPTVVPEADEMAWVDRALDIASVLQVPLVRVFSGLRGASRTIPIEEVLLRSLSLAEARGIRLLLENEPVCSVATLEETARTLATMHPNGLGLWLDLANLHDLGEASSVAIERLGPFVEYLHLKDYQDVDDDRRYCALGAGSVPWDRLASNLRALRVPCLAAETHARESREEVLRETLAYAAANL